MASAHRNFKDRIYQQVARVSKALAAPKRLELLDLLCQGPRTVEDVAQQANISVANASQHLRILRAAQLLHADKKGLFVEYRIADADVCTFYVALRRLAETRLAEVEQVTHAYFEKRGELEGIASAELVRRVKSGAVTVLDVRPAQEYRAGHIPGAISIPVDELANRLKELPKHRTIVAYCRGPYCVMAVDAVTLLRKRGFTAERMEHGVADWRARGWRVESHQPRPRRPAKHTPSRLAAVATVGDT